ncbi:MAG: hypothetical protein WB511_14480, partial [Nitrososphaeraceae archaeon]
DKNGNFMSKWGSSSNFERPTGIAYDAINELLYVNDKDRNNIQVFSVSDSAESTFRSSSHSGYTHEDGNDEHKKSKSHPKHKPECDPSYPDLCIKSPPPDLDCSDISEKNFKVTGSDPHRFDADNDGIGCESTKPIPQPPGPDCDPSYPDLCIKSPPPDLDCSDISDKNFKVTGSDLHRFDADNDGIGCESKSTTKRG